MIMCVTACGWLLEPNASQEIYESPSVGKAYTLKSLVSYLPLLFIVRNPVEWQSCMDATIDDVSQG